jgi:hypothetical protein
VPLPLLATAAVPATEREGGGGGATGVAYLTVIVQVAPGASVAPQELAVKLNNPDPFPIPATVSPVIVTAVGALAAVPVFVIVTTLLTGVRPAGIVKVRVRTPPTVASVALVAAVKTNGPAATPVPERLTGVPAPVAAPVVEV